MRQFALTDREQRLRGVHWCTLSLPVQCQQISPTFLISFRLFHPFRPATKLPFLVFFAFKRYSLDLRNEVLEHCVFSKYVVSPVGTYLKPVGVSFTGT